MKKIKFTRRWAGFTLVELLVATFLFLLLSTMLLAIVRNIITTWEYTEGQNLLHADARKILTYLKQDMVNIYTGTPCGSPMLLDYDKKGRQRLRFIKKLPSETHSSVFFDAGSVPARKGYENYYYFTHSTKKLLASGGMGEVIYLLLPKETALELWRGVKTPIEGEGSFFFDSNLQAARVKSTCHKLSSQVLYLGFKCWGSQTKNWQNTDPRQGGSSLTWDSSCQTLANFYLYQKSSRLNFVYPLKVQIELVLASRHTASAKLAKELGLTTQSISLKGGHDFYRPFLGETATVKIDDEWICYRDCENGELRGITRGFFGSKVATHSVNNKVYGGRYFSTVVALPAYHSTY